MLPAELPSNVQSEIIARTLPATVYPEFSSVLIAVIADELAAGNLDSPGSIMVDRTAEIVRVDVSKSAVP